ncbi:hypothetical protein L7F22_042981 [Adiantum nelumboides]|nr:hypothetical protein [Adiantum nelumboides]
MGRAPCCEKDSVKRGPWTPEEDAKLLACVAQHGTGSWRTLPKKAGLQRCGKSCRLRWTNYLRPDLKHGRFSDHEEQTIVKLHAALGSRWSLIAAQLPGRTDNDVKNYWNTRLKKKLCEMGIDPITHKPISQLLADLAGSMGAMTPAPQLAGVGTGSGAGSPSAACRTITDAALGCFKDDMLNVIMRSRNPSMPSTPQGSPMSSHSASLNMPPGASSSISSPTPEAGGPQLQPFMSRSIPPFLHTSSKLVSYMPHSLSQAMASAKLDGNIAPNSCTSHNINVRTGTPASIFPPFLRFLNPPPPTRTPSSPHVNTTSIPFHPFLRATSSQNQPLSHIFHRQREDPPANVRSMTDHMDSSTSNSGKSLYATSHILSTQLEYVMLFVQLL